MLRTNHQGLTSVIFLRTLLVTIPKFYGVSDLVGDKMSILKVVFIYFVFEIDVSHKNVINEFIEFENSVATAAL